LKLKPWKRAYQDTLETPNTILFTTSRTEKRENLFKWVGPLFPRQIVLYRLSSRQDIQVHHLDDLHQYRLGVLRGGSVEEYFNSKGIVNYQTVGKEVQNILKLFVGRVDLIPGSDISMAFRMKETPYKFTDLKKVFVLIDEGGYYMAINKRTPDEVVIKLNEAFTSLIEEGFRQKVSTKYLGPGYEKAADYLH
jgi:polar amino acid transport system substrate-binding protein